MNLLVPHGRSLGRLKRVWNQLCATEITRLFKILTLSEFGKILKTFNFLITSHALIWVSVFLKEDLLLQ
jgi:hypothetical protein